MNADTPGRSERNAFVMLLPMNRIPGIAFAPSAFIGVYRRFQSRSLASLSTGK
jgi:hypothetical protein